MIDGEVKCGEKERSGDDVDPVFSFADRVCGEAIVEYEA